MLEIRRFSTVVFISEINFMRKLDEEVLLEDGMASHHLLVSSVPAAVISGFLPTYKEKHVSPFPTSYLLLGCGGQTCPICVPGLSPNLPNTATGLGRLSGPSLTCVLCASATALTKVAFKLRLWQKTQLHN